MTPSLLSGLRLGLAITFAMVPLNWQWLVILLATFTDGADGFIARYFNASTWLGGLLDAVADKAFAAAVLIVFVLDDRLQLWQAVLLVTRDVAVAAIAAYAVGQGRWDAFQRMPSRLLGKVTTALLLGLLLILAAWPDQHQLIAIGMGATIIASAAAAVDYLIHFIRQYRQERAENKPATR